MANSAVSQITRIELLSYPRLSINEEQSIRAFLDACEMLSLSARVEDETIAIRRSAGLKLPDAIVAATARVHGLSLVTLDKTLKNAFLGLGPLAR